MERSDLLDRLVDEALRKYSGTEPLAGIEERILNRTRSIKREGRYFVPLAAALAGLAILCCAAGLVLVRSRPALVAERRAVAVEKTAERRPVPVQKVVLAVRARHRRVRRMAKQEQFPMPEPLTAEERALVRFAVSDPKEAAEEFASLRREMDSPIVIRPLEIAPLGIDGPGH